MGQGKNSSADEEDQEDEYMESNNFNAIFFLLSSSSSSSADRSSSPFSPHFCLQSSPYSSASIWCARLSLADLVSGRY
jgi:hypothetical protein